MPLNLEKFLQSGDHADVEFVVKPEKLDISKTFKAHKQLLALSSEVFEAMFYGQLAEKDSIVITDLHPDGFYGLLKYVYAGEARIENCFEALHTMAAAEKYRFEDLATSCLVYLRGHVGVKEACLVLDCGFESGYGSLDKVADAVLANLGYDVLRSTWFLNSRLEMVHLVLDEVSGVEEIDVVRATIKWVRSYCETGAMDFRTTISAFLPKLRFLALSPSEFVEFITSEDGQVEEEIEEAACGKMDVSKFSDYPGVEVPLPRPSVFGIKKRPTFSIGLHDYVGRPNGLLNFLEIVGGLALYTSISASPGDSKAVRLLSSSAFTFSFNSVCMMVASMASPQCAYYLPRTFYYVVFQGLGAFCYLIGTFFTMQDSQQVPAHLMIGYCVGGLHALHCGYACYKVYIQKGRSGWL